MNIYDKADELAKKLEESEEVVNLREASRKIEGSEANKKILENFRKIQMDAYSENMRNGKVSEETMKKFKDMGSVIEKNPSVNEYIQSEQKFTIMWQKILKVLDNAIGIDFSFGADKSKK